MARMPLLLPQTENRPVLHLQPPSPPCEADPTPDQLPSGSGTTLAVPNTYSKPPSSRSSSSAWLDSSESSMLKNGSWITSRSSCDTLTDCDSVEPLLPDHFGRDAEWEQPRPFSFSADDLQRMHNPKSLQAFRDFDGLPGLANGLRTDCESGLSLDEINFDEDDAFSRHAEPEPYSDRRRFFGENRLPENRVKSLLQLMWIALNDRVLILLSIVALISLALGLYQTFGQPHGPGQPRVEWVEGVTIMTAVMIAVIVGALNDFQKELQFAKLNRKKDDRLVKAIRSGRSLEISVYGVLVGDVLHVTPGDVAPADGVLIHCHNVQCDESSSTGETGHVKKTGGYEAMAKIEDGHNIEKVDPFIISGALVLEGIGTYLVTSVGVHSSSGMLMMALREDSQPTELQKKLARVANQIATAGVAVATLLFIALFIRFLTQLSRDHGSATDKGQAFLRIVIVSIAVIVIAVPEGLPLAVTLSLAIAVTRMLKDNNLVRILAACEAMGSATTVCCNKTGTLTMNSMSVTAGTVGTAHDFGDSKLSSIGDQSDNDQTGRVPQHVSLGDFGSMLSKTVKMLLAESIAINSTAFEKQPNGASTFVGSKTEAALLSFAKDRLGMGPLSEMRANVTTVQIIPFDSSRKYMATVIQVPDRNYRLYIKGAPEILLAKCTRVLTDMTSTIETGPMTEETHYMFTNVISRYATRSLRTLGFAYRGFASWSPPSTKLRDPDSNEVEFEDVFKEMTFIGIFGIQDPLRPGVTEAVAHCKSAGVSIRMVTGDNVETAKAIATECGILSPEGLIMEGYTFRNLSATQMNQVIPQLQVLARSSPGDKMLLVKKLKELNEIVAVKGDGTNDGPALRAADVGFSMGLSGTEVAKEASSIVLIDDNFSSIVKAIEWGRTVNDGIRKFLQFQLTVNITAVTLTFVSAVTSDTEESILTPVQLLWVNLIMDTFAALALATDPPNPHVLDRKPEPKSAPLITPNMWKMMISQSLYQLVVTLSLNFAGNRILRYDTPAKQERLETVVFNTYVWMTFFNQFNSRRLDNKFNIFEGLHRNWYFLGINLIIITGQVLIIFFGGSALSATRLDVTQWAISVTLGAVSLPIGILTRLIPDRLVGVCLKLFPGDPG